MEVLLFTMIVVVAVLLFPAASFVVTLRTWVPFGVLVLLHTYVYGDVVRNGLTCVPSIANHT